MVMHRDLPRVLGGGIGKYYFSILPMCLQVDEEAIPGGNSGTRECKKKKKKDVFTMLLSTPAVS